MTGDPYSTKAQLKKLLMYLHTIGPKARLKFIMSLDDGLKCHYCRTPLEFENQKAKNYATRDHVIVKSKGGTREPENLVIACISCNTERGDMNYHAFLVKKGKA